MTAWCHSIPTPDGVFAAWFTRGGLSRLDFPHERPSPTPSPVSGPPPKEIRFWQSMTARAVKNALRGRKPEALPPLDWSDATEFQRRVWAALLDIAPGRPRSYGEIASNLGCPGAARAVGAACGANPIPLLVPCHRVVAAGGGLGGFSAGLHWKKLLLHREGIIQD
jgi:O-6-methylguanine DNA methyltransferase